MTDGFHAPRCHFGSKESGRKWDPSLVSAYYRSGSLNFEHFRNAHFSPQQQQPPPPPASSPSSPAAAAGAKLELTSPTKQLSSPHHPPPQPRRKDPTSPPSQARATPQRLVPLSPLPVTPSAPRANANATNAATTTTTTAVAAPSAYIDVLRQQQQLAKLHQQAVDDAAGLTTARQQWQSAVQRANASALELVRQLEGLATWGQRSQYGVAQMVRDCMLELEPVQLAVPDAPPSTEGFAVLQRQLRELRATGRLPVAEGSDPPPPDAPPVELAGPDEGLRLFFDQATRRVDGLRGVVDAQPGGNDYAAMSRWLDHLLVAVEQTLRLPTVESLVRDAEARIDKRAFAMEQLAREKDAAVVEGEVHIAERCLYGMLAQSEDALADIVAKSRVIDQALEAQRVMLELQQRQRGAVAPLAVAVRHKCAKMTERCQRDAQKLCALRAKVEEVEAVTATKVAADLAATEVVLADNEKRQAVLFAEIAERELKIEALVRERQRVLLRRLQEREKDGQRRAEFARFCDVVVDHAPLLTATERNMHALTHAAETLAVISDLGYEALVARSEKRLKLLAAIEGETHKQHAAALRHCFGQLGEVQYRKMRMLEEIDRAVQAAHVQQELHAATFNPAAKRFGDVKKRLLQSRSELEDDTAELAQRAQAALEQFGAAEKFLTAQGVAFVHPVHAQHELGVALRVRAIESRAAALGLAADSPVGRDIRRAQREAVDLRQECAALNEATSGMTGRTIPLLRATSSTLSMV